MGTGLLWNDDGNSARVHFQVYVSHDFTVQPDGESDVVVEYNGSAELKTRVTAAYPDGMTYQWYVWNDVNGRWDILENEHGTSLLIDPVQKYGEYQFLATDKFGNERYCNFTVRVDNGFSAGVDGSSDFYDVSPGSEVTFKIWARFSSGDITYEWFAYDNNSGRYDPVEGESGPTYTMRNIRSMQWCYCRVRDMYGNEKTVHFSVSVATDGEVNTVELNKSSLMMIKEDTARLTATVYPESASDKTVTWSSSDESIATVDRNGKVSVNTEGKIGYTTITVRTNDGGFTAECQVRVIFSDVLLVPLAEKDHGYAAHVYWAAEKGITKGIKGTDKFGVKDNCTRGQCMMFLWRFLDKPEATTTTQKFSDVPKSNGFFTAVQWASDNNVTKGYNDGTFGVNKTCTRGHFVTFLHRAVGD